MNEKRLFLSYCWADKDIADYIDSYCSRRNIPIIRDIRDIGKWESIKLFMRKIRKSDYAILIITANYLKSKNCMYEIMEMMKEINYRERIIPLILPESNVFDSTGKLDYIKFWKSEYDHLRKKVADVEDIEVTIEVLQELKIISEIYRNIGEFISLISDMNCPQKAEEFCDCLIRKFFILNDNHSKVIDRYSFSNFFVANFNQFAYETALSVSENLGGSYNPLLLSGSSGTGKTHLLHAIANSAVIKDPGCKVLYHSCESFTSDLIIAFQKDKKAEFINQFRHINLLIIDDIQFLKGKERTQEELFYIFDMMADSNNQVVFAANCPPRDLKLTDMVQSRCLSGLIAEITTPNKDERFEYLKWRCSRSGMNDISDNTLIRIINNTEASIWQLEGAFKNLLPKKG